MGQRNHTDNFNLHAGGSLRGQFSGPDMSPGESYILRGLDLTSAQISGIGGAMKRGWNP